MNKQVLTEKEREDIHASMQNYAACNINIFNFIAEEIEAAVLSKLRAPVAVEAVAWETDGLGPTNDPELADVWRKIGWPVRPLYAAPPTQLRELAEVWRKNADELREYGADAVAATLEECADELDSLNGG